MVEIKFIVPTDKFKDELKKIRDKGLKERQQKQIDKLAANPDFGKPLRYALRPKIRQSEALELAVNDLVSYPRD